MKNLQRRRLERTRTNLQNPKRKVRKSPRLPRRLQQWALPQELQKEQERVKVNPDSQGGKSNQPTSKDDRSKQPCMYFAHNSCTKGDKRPYLHDKNDLYSGPLPKALAKNTSAGSATVQAGVAKIVSGAVVASSLKRAEGARSESAPHPEVPKDGCADCSRSSKAGSSKCKWVYSASKRVVKSIKSKSSNPTVFNKAFKCIAAMMAVCDPMSHRQEFLIDSGAGRNLISKKDMPDEWKPYLSDPTEH